MLAIPRMQVLVPGHGREVDQLLRAVVANGEPTYMRTSLATNDEPHDVAPGRLEVIRRGDGPTVVAFGPMLTRALEATAHLDATVVYATSLEPFDGATLRELAGDAPDVVVVEPWYEGTAAAGDHGRVRRCGGSPAVHRGSTPVHPSLRHVAGARRLLGHGRHGYPSTPVTQAIR